MTDPFAITGHTVVANSGGKTSGYNLWRHLQANGGTLTGLGRCVFTNTGWESPKTLDFLAEQARRWAVKVHWLEFTRRPATEAELCRLETKWQKAIDRLARFRSEPPSFFAGRKRKKPATLFAATPDDRKAEAVRKAGVYATNCFESWRKAELIGTDWYRQVDRATASTDGRPFTELLEGLLKFRTEVKSMPGVLPNGVQHICTGHLKVRNTTRFAQDEWGITDNAFECRLGLRADEEERLKNAQEWGKDGGQARFPLAEAGIHKEDVAAFWKSQSFRLDMKSHEGNCTFCHMKKRSALLDLIRRRFGDVDWWHGWEVRTGQRFRKERSYLGLINAAAEEKTLPGMEPDDYDNAITCEGGYCTD